MRSVNKYLSRVIIASAGVLALSWTPVIAQGQGQQTTSQSQSHNDDDVTRREIASFDRFLDDNPSLEKQLEANPALVKDSNFLATHPALQAFLADHPRVQGELQENPADFMRRQNRFEGTNADRDNRTPNPNPDLNNRELGRMDQFLDEHRDVEQQLALNPSLINDPTYLAQHQDLQAFLNEHPQVREEFSENPSYFMHRENQTEGRPADQDRQRNPNPDLNQREIGRMDQFLDEHHEIERQLQQNPTLINDSNFLSQHQDLALFLNDHPRIREEFSENPNYFMRRENQTEGTPADRDRADQARSNRAQNPNPDVTNREIGRMDQFLDEHRNIEQDLERNPSLLGDSNYLAQHQDLQAFLSAHPQIREEIAENPNYFMQRENQAEGTAADRDRADRDRTNATPRPANPNPDLTNQEASRMDQFLDDHPKIEKELQKKPSLINDSKYLNHNRDLATFLNAHPQVREEFAENPNYFMQREAGFERTGADRDSRTSNPNPDLNSRELAEMDQFLDKHKKIGKELAKDPALVTSPNYLDHHKDLGKVLDAHTQVREEFREDPRNFMERENRFEQREHMTNNHRKADTDKRLDDRANLDHKSQ